MSILGEFPRINFTRGFTCLTLLTASEKVGVLFAAYILLHTERGQAIMEKVLSRQQEKYVRLYNQDIQVEDTVRETKAASNQVGQIDADTSEVVKEKRIIPFQNPNGHTVL